MTTSFSTAMDRRRCIAASAAGLLALAGLPLRAQAAGTLLDNAKILSGFAAGGTADVVARRIADKLRGVYARNVIVENRTGAGGQIALSALKGATADGATAIVTPMSMLGIYPHTYRKLAYDPLADFAPVSQAVNLDMGLAVGPMVPAGVTTAPEFAKWAQAHPQLASFGSPAAGSVPHFVGALFGRAAGIPDYRHVPYRGSQPAISDLLGGQIASVCGPVGEFLQHLPGGRARMLATSGARRSRFTPHVATFAEQGLRDLVYDEWFGVFVPARTPQAQIDALAAALRTALTAPDLVEGLAQMGLEARASTPAELAALVKRDTERWGPIVKQIGFTAET